uniref:Uncharacterized protein n=1 Tax=Ananas comosus var. bracteatus TaxID=296719 RepID=A0A6V7QML4_ANACO|nr:unnamed protein product [Ananas comosus var. bracteatus]
MENDEGEKGNNDSVDNNSVTTKETKSEKESGGRKRLTGDNGGVGGGVGGRGDGSHWWLSRPPRAPRRRHRLDRRDKLSSPRVLEGAARSRRSLRATAGAVANETWLTDTRVGRDVVVGAVDDPELVVSEVHKAINKSRSSSSSSSGVRRRELGYLSSCGTGNPIDDCWRCDPQWHHHRKRLADCGIGFGRNAVGGRNGRFYVVTDPSDDDPVNPARALSATPSSRTSPSGSSSSATWSSPSSRSSS